MELPGPSSSGCPNGWQWAPTPTFTEGTTKLWQAQVLSLGTQTVHTHLAPCQRGIHPIGFIEPFKPRQAKLIETSCGISQWQILCFGRSSDLAEKRRCTKGKLQLKLAQPLNVAEGRSNVMLPISSFSEVDLGKSKFGARSSETSKPMGKQSVSDF